jgi:hypothetical protein
MRHGGQLNVGTRISPSLMEASLLGNLFFRPGTYTYDMENSSCSVLMMDNELKFLYYSKLWRVRLLIFLKVLWMASNAFHPMNGLCDFGILHVIVAAAEWHRVAQPCWRSASMAA